MLESYLRAGYPAIAMITPEPYRAELAAACDGWQFLAWDCMRGMRNAGNPVVIDQLRDPVEVLHHLDFQQDTVLIAHNLHLFLESPELIQAIQNGIPQWKATGCCLVIVAPTLRLPPELEKLVHVLDLPLPNSKELFLLQQKLIDGLAIQHDDEAPVLVQPDRSIAETATGLTEFEAETAFALCLVKRGHFSRRVIADVKAQMLRKSGLMELWQSVEISDVGGLDQLKSYITNRAKAFSPGNKYLPKPKGILLLGLPGTGKSLTCKATASILGWPLIRLDLSSLKNSLVGESERRMRQATQVIEAFGNAVVWVDEIEKSLAGVQSSGQSDAGTTASMFGHFLTWLQETTAPVLVMATANDISKLPPELLRAGRFDAVFFVDLPTPEERIQILRIMAHKYQTVIADEHAFTMQGFTGAEIEQVVKDSLFDGLDQAMSNVVPLSRTMKEEIRWLQRWATTRARPASTPLETTDIRKVRATHKAIPARPGSPFPDFDSPSW